MSSRKIISIAFDCDETLWSNGIYGGVHDGKPNVPIVNLFRALERLPHTKMYVWSHGGQEWAEQVAIECNLQNYEIIEKPFPIPEDKSNMPDIAVDDIDDLGKLLTLFVE